MWRLEFKANVLSCPDQLLSLLCPLCTVASKQIVDHGVNWHTKSNVSSGKKVLHRVVVIKHTVGVLVLLVEEGDLWGGREGRGRGGRQEKGIEGEKEDGREGRGETGKEEGRQGRKKSGKRRGKNDKRGREGGGSCSCKFPYTCKFQGSDSFLFLNLALYNS